MTSTTVQPASIVIGDVVSTGRMRRMCLTLAGTLAGIVLLAIWAHAMRSQVKLPTVGGPLVGIPVLFFGLLLICFAEIARRGRGIYGYIAHPLHCGAALACLGMSLTMRQSSALYVVSPLAILCAMSLALVGPRLPHGIAPALSLALEDDAVPGMWSRLAVFPMLFIPWLLMYESVVNFGPPPCAFEGYLPGELHWPIYQWAEIIYFSPYILVTLAPFAATSNRLLRRFTIAGMLATAVGHFIFLVVPAIATPRPFMPSGVLGRMMLWDRVMDQNNGTAAFPSFHAIWGFLGAGVFAARWPRLRLIAWLWAIAVALSCVFTGMHALIDIIAGFALYLATWNYARLRQWASAAILALRGRRNQAPASPGILTPPLLCNLLIPALVLAIWPLRGHPWAVLAAVAIAAPWARILVRAIRVAPDCVAGVGERAKIDLKPLYLLVCDLLVGIAMLRLWAVGAPASLTAGLCAFLLTLSWFVGVAVQWDGRLRLRVGYSAAGMLLAAAAMMCLRAPTTDPHAHMLWPAAILALAIGFSLEIAARFITAIGVSANLADSTQDPTRMV